MIGAKHVTEMTRAEAVGLGNVCRIFCLKGPDTFTEKGSEPFSFETIVNGQVAETLAGVAAGETKTLTGKLNLPAGWRVGYS